MRLGSIRAGACVACAFKAATSALGIAAPLIAMPLMAAAGDAEQQPTDIGRVSTAPEPAESVAPSVAPSATTDRSAAVTEKQEAPNILEVQPLSEIVKLPDINTAEALQRIPGVSLETDSGEGRFVSIRGLDSDLNGTSYAGVRLPATNPSSPFGGSRAVAFDAFPTGIVGGIEVTKTGRPDKDAEALGGSINLVPRTGVEHGGAPFLDSDLGGGYEPLRRTPIYHGELSAGRSFNGGDGLGGWFAGADAINLVLNAVIHHDQRGIDDIEESYTDQQSSGVPDKVLSNLQFRRYEYHRNRFGFAGNLEAKASDATTLYLRLLWSGYLETAHKHYLVLDSLDSDTGCAPLPGCIQDPTDPSGYIASGGTLTQRTTDTLERVGNDLAIVGGTSTFSAFKLDYRGSFALGTDRFSSSYGSTWTDPNSVPIAYDTNTDPRYPRYRILNGVNPADPSNYTLQEIDLGPSYDQDREWGAGLDATIPLGGEPSNHGSGGDELKFGASLRLRHKTHESTSPVFTPNGAIPLQPFTYGASQIYYKGLYSIGPAISLPALRALVDSNLGTVTDDAAADASANSDDSEDVYAGYGQYAARFGRFGILAGLRIESTHATYRGNIYNSDLDSNAPSTQTRSYTNFFPTLQARYDILDDLTARLSYSTGIARPGFNQITPGASVSVANASVSVGNPELKPTVGQNFDATLEFYPGNGQIASFGLFDKQFSNYILQTQQIVSGYNFPGLTGVITTVQSFSNGPARAYGLEAQYQQQLKVLPAPFDGLGYSGNVTWVGSRAQIHPGIYGLLPSTSRLTWNAALFYEHSGFDLRVAADYVGQNLFAFGGIVGDQFDVYSRQRLTMDAGASYAITGKVRVYFDAKNLLNTPLEFTEGRSDFRPIQREFYDLTLLAGVRVSLH